LLLILTIIITTTTIITTITITYFVQDSDLDDLWRYILRSPTDGGHGRLCSLLGQPKIRNLDLVNVVGSGQQQVLQLQISVHNTSAPDTNET